MADLPSHQRALLLESKQAELVLGYSVVSKPGPGQLLVKVKATALNPIGWKIQRFGLLPENFPAILGIDFSGDILAIGQGVTKFEVGDKVICLGRAFTVPGSFQEYTLADENYTSKIPSNITCDQAATLPMGLATAYLGMYNKPPHGMGLVSPLEASSPGYYKTTHSSCSAEPHPLVRLFANLSGFNPIITTASLENTDYLKSLGATHVLDRKSSPSELKSEIRKTSSRPIEHIYDAVSSSETQNTKLDILCPGGTLIVIVDPVVAATNKQVFHILAFRDSDHNIAPLTVLYRNLTELIKNGLIKPNRVELLPDGLVGIIAGLKKMEENKVSGVKLVARPEETAA